MPDATTRIALIFEHPKSTKKEPIMIGISIPFLIANGPPTTKKGKPWKFLSTEIIQ